MSWAARRRFLTLFIVGAITAAFLAVVLIATFYEVPSCIDNKQNQGEAGIDCGGPCAYLCRADLYAPTVLYTKALTNSSGRTDVIASVENKNAGAAARGVPYRIDLYGSDRILIQEVKGTIDLPPASTVAVFVAGVSSGRQTVTSAFLTIDADMINWIPLARDPRLLPIVTTPQIGGTTNAPRITVQVSNPSPTVALIDTRLIAIVRSADRNIIGASATIVPNVGPSGVASGLFTWNEPFTGVPALVEVVPEVALPAQAGLP